MQKFLLTLATLFACAAALHAQEVGTSNSNPPAPSVSAPAQPIPFNHKQHIQTAKMSCSGCHEPRNNGTTLALPQAAKCMGCHNSIATDKSDIQRLAEAAKNEDPIPWVRVYRVPSFVTFSHQAHSGTSCEQCHGPVAERTAIALEKNTSMGTCIACHQAKGAVSTCDTCHAIMTKNDRPPFHTDSSVLARLHMQPAAKPATTEPAWRGGSRVTPQFDTLASFLHAQKL